MKSIILRILLISIVSISFTAFIVNGKDYQTECVNTHIDGYTTFKIWNPKKGKRYKFANARKDAVHALLFSGVSGGNDCMTQRPILRSEDSMKKFEKIETTFFSRDGKWSAFTRSSATEKTVPTEIGKKNWKVYVVSVSKKELINYLEGENIIKSLANGF